MKLPKIVVSLLALAVWANPTPIHAAPQKTLTFTISESKVSKETIKPYGPMQISTVVMVPKAKKIGHGTVPRTTVKAKSTGSYNVCSCVSYARYITGINVGHIGLAKYHPINSQTPKLGAIVVLNEGAKTGHLAAVIGIAGTTITIAEANYSRCKIGTRILNISDPRIRGYYY